MHRKLAEGELWDFICNKENWRAPATRMLFFPGIRRVFGHSNSPWGVTTCRNEPNLPFPGVTLMHGWFKGRLIEEFPRVQ